MTTEKRPLRLRLVGDIVTQPLGKLVKHLPEFDVTVTHGDFGAIAQELMSGPAVDALVLFASAAYFLAEGQAGAQERMDAFCAEVSERARSGREHLILTLLDYSPGRFVGTRYFESLRLIGDLNRRLIDLALANASVSLIDLPAVVAKSGRETGLRHQNRLVMRYPFSKQVSEDLMAAIALALRERMTPRLKVVCVDADNTLWGGVVGEDGADGIAIDDQDFPGNLHWEFQLQLKALKEAGVILALVSKNNEEDVCAAFDQRRMALSLGDFSARRINWEPKSRNIAEIAEELNLGLDAFVFVDDNPFEIEEVSAVLPEVLCLRFERENADSALRLLDSVPDLKAWAVTDEDRAKAAQYATEAERRELRTKFTSVAEYVASLEIELIAGRNRRSQIKRIAQLTNKTNQFNLTTRRYSEAEIASLMEKDSVFDFQVRDRLGDLGVVGVVIVRGREIDTFLMSCRALGRQVESQMLRIVCHAVGGDGLRAAYLPTAKNRMVAEFLDANGFERVAEDGASRHYIYAGGPSANTALSIREIEECPT